MGEVVVSDRMELGHGDYAKYPFLRGAGRVIAEIGLTPQDIAEDPGYKPLIEGAIARIQFTASGGVPGSKDGDADYDIYTFILAAMLVRTTNSAVLRGRFALAESRRSEKFLLDEIRAPDTRRKAFLIFSEVFGADLEEDGGEISMGIPAYLSHASGFHEREWDLVNRTVTGGRVVIPAGEAVRLVRAAISGIISEGIMSSPAVLTGPKWALEQAARIGADVTPARTKQSGKIAPCMAHAIKFLEEGNNLPHSGRFMLATYMLSRGEDPAAIAALFENAPDYNKNVTEYQIRTLSGAGEGDGYKCPGCEHIKSRDLCFPDAGCEGIRHPLGYKGG